MIPRLKGVIAHSHDTKLLGEDGEGSTAGWGTRPSPKVKLFKKDLGDTPTRGLGNRTNPEKDLTPAHGWGTDPTLRRSPTFGRGSGKVYTHPAVDEDQTDGCRYSSFGLRVKIDPYLKRARQMGKSLITVSTKQTDFGLMTITTDDNVEGCC